MSQTLLVTPSNVRCTPVMFCVRPPWLPTRGRTTVPSLSTCLSLASRGGVRGAPVAPPPQIEVWVFVPAGTEVPGYVDTRVPLGHWHTALYQFMGSLRAQVLRLNPEWEADPLRAKKKAPLF